MGERVHGSLWDILGRMTIRTMKLKLLDLRSWMMTIQIIMELFADHILGVWWCNQDILGS